jgi:uncharacterized membrane protein YkvA (DUF1232 family)
MNDRLTVLWNRLHVGRNRKPRADIDPGDYVGRDPARNERTVRDGFVAKAKRCLRRLPLAEETVAMYFCMLDPATPLWVKTTAAAALAYFILPFDALPDIIPVVGLSDDASVLAVALSTVAAHVTDAHRARARAWMAHEQLGPAAS